MKSLTNFLSVFCRFSISGLIGFFIVIVPISMGIAADLKPILSPGVGTHAGAGVIGSDVRRLDMRALQQSGRFKLPSIPPPDVRVVELDQTMREYRASFVAMMKALDAYDFKLRKICAVRDFTRQDRQAAGCLSNDTVYACDLKLAAYCTKTEWQLVQQVKRDFMNKTATLIWRVESWRGVVVLHTGGK